MKQLFQDLKNGTVFFEELPAPSAGRERVVIASAATLISKGTEKMLLDFGQASLIGKIRQQPEKFQQVLAKISTDGLRPTLEAVKAKLEQPLAMGYCNAGIVAAVGEGVRELRVGDRVLSNGAHAELVSVPQSLCVRIPDEVSDSEAPFAVIGAIALQGMRLAEPTLGEHFVVMGLGLIGLLAVQLLRANGCEVIGIDFDPHKLALAESFGARTLNLSAVSDPVASVLSLTGGRGADGVLIAASTSSNLPMHQAALFSRKRGRIVLIGTVGLELTRADFYEKELSFQVSCSYGPGRYDSNFEERGLDYPIGFVRWTEQRNFAAVLQLMAQKKVDVTKLISKILPFSEAPQAYDLVNDSSLLGLLLSYPNPAQRAPQLLAARSVEFLPEATTMANAPVVGFIGAGNYGSRVLIPAFKKTGARLKYVATNAGAGGVQSAKFFAIEQATTNTDQVLNDTEINCVVISTRHDSHAALASRSLRAGRHVFLEKPLAIRTSELAELQAAYRSAPNSRPKLMVGFNRRFAPQIKKMKALLSPIPTPKTFIVTVNAGAIPAAHWTQDPQIGGGRILGEACHFVDLLRFLAGARITNVEATQLHSPHTSSSEILDDKMSITLSFADGSVGTIHYFANGHASFPKERIEVFCAGQILQLDNFKKMRGYGWNGFKKMNLWSQDKGQSACAAEFVEAIRNGQPSPIPFDELVEVAEACFSAVQKAQSAPS